MSENTGFWRYFWNSNNNQDGPDTDRSQPDGSSDKVSTPEADDSPSDSTTVPMKRKAAQPSTTRSVVLRHKPSTTSLASMTAGKWLGWNSRKEANQLSEEQEGDEEQYHDSNEEFPEDEELQNDDTVPDDNGDEIDDHVSKKRGSSWAFWSNNNNNSHNNHINSPEQSQSSSPPPVPMPEPKSTKNAIESESDNSKNKITHVANTIVNSTPFLPSKSELSNKSSDDTTQQTNDDDDAVLYKPHDKTAQFNQINTHKNENLKENIIVPDWDTCLPRASEGVIFHSSSTANQGNSNQTVRTDLKNWKQFLNQISTKFGLSTGPIIPEPEAQPSPPQDTFNDNKVERDVGLLYEKSYKLYGKSLAILPEDKRGCLPNYNKYYHNIDGSSTSSSTGSGSGSPSQLEDDASDPNSISITNDAMGNLLINSSRKRRAIHTAANAEVISHKAGPLKKIKNILIIGVHGFFPTRMIRPIIGAPKGTSLKFANEAEKAVIRYCLENDLINESESKVSIQKIALEKEGKIFDRVEFFTEILQKWEKELNNADFIFIASHSQGCVVSIILLARLIKMGILRDPMHKRIGILGMAGVNNGPFYGVDKSFFMKAYSAIEHESMNELFELNKFDSQQSSAYKESIQTIIDVNVKICLIASINDQLVPLFSALASHIFHPNIYRACYIDSTSQTPKFVEKLVSLCTHLINVGFFDNNVIKELSTSLAGPFTGNGHSKIYNDGKVYDLGIKFVLDTDDIVIPSETGEVSDDLNVKELPVSNQVYVKEFNISKIGTNPYILPWCLRGFLFNVERNWPNRNMTQYENEYGLKNGYEEIHELYETFENWKPETKVYKDLKFRLNGFRASKL